MKIMALLRLRHSCLVQVMGLLQLCQLQGIIARLYQLCSVSMVRVGSALTNASYIRIVKKMYKNVHVIRYLYKTECLVNGVRA